MKILEKWGIMQWLDFGEKIYSITQLRAPIMGELICGRREALIHRLEQKILKWNNPNLPVEQNSTRSRMIYPPWEPGLTLLLEMGGCISSDNHHNSTNIQPGPSLPRIYGASLLISLFLIIMNNQDGLSILSPGHGNQTEEFSSLHRSTWQRKGGWHKGKKYVEANLPFLWHKRY